MQESRHGGIFFFDSRAHGSGTREWLPEQVNDDGSVYFRIFVKPLVNLIWLAGLVFLLGSVIALWPDAREQRRLAVRYDEAGGAVRGK